MNFDTFRDALGALALAADREAREQTPPNGDRGATYHCPACLQTRTIRGELRAHLIMCDKYRAMILGMHPRQPTQVS